ncbi:hypothetical protein [Streptomyces sp. A1499]|uniref:hypothetical protein n=1 Tax=Streptomyces sp. A1499 TaxID=2563104 RepID=UPI00109E85FB|nr:hypothetical protein [Streptomyces sp. A1499]THC54063.1 hypothetical protein E7X58_05615 [Streptomyces sp. A1499]
MSTETGTETHWDTEPQHAVTTTGAAQGTTATATSGAGKHRGPVAEHDEATSPRGRHRRQAAHPGA